ncbi:MAG: transglutaminase-like domain-containing protein [Gammaproteobacteria bacterium]|nr:transglutaminase-like domain-containing protein [Gammaproteobacteria bacterium]
MKTTKTPEKNKKAMLKIALLLFLASLLLMLGHSMFLEKLRVQGDENWLISLDITYMAEQNDSVLIIQPPYESEYLRLVGRKLSHPGLRVMHAPANSLNKRAIRLRSREAGNYPVAVEFTLQLNQTPHFHSNLSKELSTERRQYFLADNEWLQLDNTSLGVLLTEIGFDQARQERLPENIYSYVQSLPGKSTSQRRRVPDVLKTRSANQQEKALLMVALCRKAGVPARMITGLELKDDPVAASSYWVEAFVNGRWHSYHPALGYINNLPNNFVALDKYGDGIISATVNATKLPKQQLELENAILIEQIADRFISPDNTRDEWYQVFILDRLPGDTREQLSLLMLLPLGALLCGFIRQFGGLHSYGVFTPTILALAVTYSEIETTLLILLITALLVYLARPAFHHEMSRTPRLSIIFTLVSVGMVLGVSVLDHFSFATGGELILLPIVIITSLIDRFFAAVDSLSYRTAIIRLMWTLLLMLTVLPILQLSWLGGWILRYPEFHLITLSLLIMISYYPFGKHKLPKSLSWLTERDKKREPKQSEDRTGNDA